MREQERNVLLIMLSERSSKSPPRKTISAVVQKLPYNHKRAIPEIPMNKIAMMKPTRNPTKAAMP